jgi:hypothetical protein
MGISRRCSERTACRDVSYGSGVAMTGDLPEADVAAYSTRSEWSEWRVVITGLVAGALSGAALGVLWWQLAPRATVAIRPDGARPQGFQPEEYLAADVSFAALALVAGLILTVALAATRRHHLLGVLAAGLLASAVGTVAMWQVGTRLGSVDIEGLIATTSEEFVVDAPLEVTMPGVFLVWAIGSATVVLVLAVGDWLAGRTSHRN